MAKQFNRDIDLAGGARLMKGATVLIDADGNIDAPLTTTNLTVSGTTTLGDAVTDTTGITGATTITSTSASALTVGANGATNPVLKVAASTASVATGLSLTGAAAAGGMAVAVVSSGTNENLTVDAKGSGTISIGSVSTGNISLARGTTVNGQFVANGQSTVAAGEAVGAGGSSNCNLVIGNVAGFGIYTGSGAPTVSAAKGSLYLRTDGSGVTDRAFINTNGSTTWTALTTVA
ncbi:MAG: hypothetical protein JW384_02738 [Nitrosomonadaceae bacterium]|nr:hypothetical protein [Nitrosomonadaceae bacterium]